MTYNKSIMQVDTSCSTLHSRKRSSPMLFNATVGYILPLLRQFQENSGPLR